ncbi:hypothetical protein [Candidatus Electronema sp. JM]|uniref:hypothetical protein n=1 Tax=Candidatus Electronema sp. JM TaxID=3401571 RepID=UPI003AA9CC28
MSRRKHSAPDAPPHDQREPRIIFAFQLSLSGILGIGAVLFCLFLWMFLLGIWAGKTLLPQYPVPPAAASSAPIKNKMPESSAPPVAPVQPARAEPPPARPAAAETLLILPTERKKRIAPPRAAEETR